MTQQSSTFSHICRLVPSDPLFPQFLPKNASHRQDLCFALLNFNMTFLDEYLIAAFYC